MPQARITLKVHPRSKRVGVTVLEGGVVEVRVSAPPDRGKANAAVVGALADALDVPVSAVEIVRGRSTREKVVIVEGLSQEEAMRRILSR